MSISYEPARMAERRPIVPVTFTPAVESARESWQLVADLNDVLGPTLVAIALHVRDHTAPRKWATPGSRENVDGDSYTRLVAAHRALRIILDEGYGGGMARLWFLGSNPLLDDERPIDALHKGEGERVVAAARIFADDGWA